MAATLRIDIDDAPARQVLADIDRRARDLFPAMDAIGAALADSTRERFETGIAPDGETWPRSIRAIEDDGQTLVDTGRLRGSITHRAGADSVDVGTNVLYAAVHQFGATIRAKTGNFLTFSIGGRFVQVAEVKIPARPYIGLSAADRADVHDILRDHIRGGVVV